MNKQGNNTYRRDVSNNWLFSVVLKSREVLFVYLIIFILIGIKGSVLATCVDPVTLPDTEQTLSDTTMSADTRLMLLISEIEREWKGDNKEQAEAMAREGFLFVGENNVHDSVYAALLHVYGKILVDRQKNRQGIDSLIKSANLKKKVFGNDHFSLAKTYNYIGIGYLQLHEFEKASKYYKLSIKILHSNSLWNQNLFDAYLNMGIVEAVKGKYDNAYRYFDTIQIIIDSIGPDVDSVLVARFYFNYGTLATFNGQLNEGNRYFDKAGSIFMAKYGRNYIGLSDINLNKGLNAYYNYDFVKAILYSKKALDIYKANNRVKDRVPRTYANLAAAALKSNNYVNTINYSLTGLEYDPNDELKWLLYSNIAQAYMELDVEKKVLFFFRKATSLEDEGEINPVTKISLFVAYAYYMLIKGHLKESKKYYDEVQDIILHTYGRHSAAYANILSKIANYYLETSAIDSSMYYYNASIQLWTEVPDSNSVNPETLNEVKFAEAYIGRARAYYFKYKETGEVRFLKLSYAGLRMILDKMEEVSSKLDKESKLLLNDQLNPAYGLSISTAYRLYEITHDTVYLSGAFNYSEKSKSAVLLASIRNISALKSSGVPPDIMKKEKELNEEINGIRQMLADEQQKNSPSQTKISFFESRLLELIIDHDSLVSNLEKNYPKYYTLKYDRSAISLKEVLEKLKNDEAVIEYAISDTVVYIFCFTRQELTMTKSTLDSLFWDSMDYLLNIKNVDISTMSLKEINIFYKHSTYLWSALIAPVYDIIQSKRLVIIPDGVLGYLPFEILAKESDKQQVVDFRTVPYLIKEFPVSYSYSLTLKYNPYFMKHEKTNNELIAFAPVYGTDTLEDSIRGSFQLENLPYAREEAINIKDMWGGEVFTGKMAVKSNFLKNASDFKVLHLAMHTMINDTAPMLSKLIFTKNEHDTASNLLYTYEIYDLNLKASMVTLSACNTGTGLLRTGEGIMSLARGFIYAGVPSIVMTLWEVQDKSGEELMKDYYRNLLDGDTKDVALQKAKLLLLQSSTMAKAHPFYWSAYIITGDTKPLTSSGTVKKLWYVWAMIGFILLLTLWYFKRRSGNVQ